MNKAPLLTQLALYMALLISAACSKSDKRRTFIETYGESDFSKFKGYAFFVRSVDRAGDAVVFVYNMKTPTTCPSFYPVTVNLLQHSVTPMVTRVDSTCFKQTGHLNQLALEFVQYDVNRMYVDTLNNVFIHLALEREPDMVKLLGIRADDKFFTQAHYVRVNPTWLVRSE